MNKIFSKLFTARVLEQCGVAAVVAFGAALSVPGVSLDKSAVLAGLVAAGRAVYGVVVASVGAPESPSVK